MIHVWWYLGAWRDLGLSNVALGLGLRERAA